MADYSALDKFLHRLVLGNRAVAELLHDIERGRYLKSSPQARGVSHVFVTGLARAGSTILLREIHATGVFGSLTYADMPFVLAPNLWASLARAKAAGPRAERAHGDGIEVDTQSPEALEEVYWRIFSGGDYILARGLARHSPAAEVMDGYLDLIRLILRHTGKARYLAKNNNGILRLRPLALAMPQSVFLLPMRAPLQHAQSLLNQHRRFLQADRFTKDYMAWLAHHEFGATQRPFLLDAAPGGDPDTLDYWLALWMAVYADLGAVAAELGNTLIVPYEDLTGNPAVWASLCALIGCDRTGLTELRHSKEKDVAPHRPELADQAGALYQTLRHAALQRLLQ